jgi:hypothetical protein
VFHQFSNAPLTVVRKGSSILELLSGEDQSLLVWGNTLLVLDLGFDIVDGVGRLHLEGDGLARKAILSASERGSFLEVRSTYVFTKICMALACPVGVLGIKLKKKRWIAAIDSYQAGGQISSGSILQCIGVIECGSLMPSL